MQHSEYTSNLHSVDCIIAVFEEYIFLLGVLQNLLNDAVTWLGLNI